MTKRFIMVSNLLIVCVLLLIGCGGGSDESSEPVHKEPEAADEGLRPGQTPPSLAIETLDGGTFDPQQLDGQKVLIKFWATWCQYCMQEMPDVIQLDQTYDDLTVVAVNVMETAEKVRPVVEKYEMPFPILMDETYELSRSYQVLGLPTSYYLHADGTIAFVHTGPSNYDHMLEQYEALNEFDS